MRTAKRVAAIVAISVLVVAVVFGDLIAILIAALADNEIAVLSMATIVLALLAVALRMRSRGQRKEGPQGPRHVRKRDSKE
jgi:hypothetical protein